MARLTCFVVVISTTASASAHDGPDPLCHWKFERKALEKNVLQPRIGAKATLSGRWTSASDKLGDYIQFGGKNSAGLIAKDHRQAKRLLPTESFTVAGWVAISQPHKWGGLLGVMRDNGDHERGWLLGYNEKTFTVALATKAGKKLTYLAGKTPYKRNVFYHVAATYDGKELCLYVNGKLDASSKAQSGPIWYPERAAPFLMAAYRDDDENYPFVGYLRELKLYDRAAKAAWVKHDFSHLAKAAALPPAADHLPPYFVIKPYLQFGTQTSMTVMWRTSKPCAATLWYGETAKCVKSIPIRKTTSLHEQKIAALRSNTQYFYRVENRFADGKTLSSPVSTFQTAVDEKTPFAFAIISDTQGNPKVASQIAALAWGQRPNLMIHAGDLVDTGKNDQHWTEQFFPSLHALISRVPFYPVLGNHEQNAKNYFDYVSLPSPEYHYDFRFGNAQFFMIDSNRNIAPGSPQYLWLQKRLAASKAKWKFVCHHHPPFSSDENDYGNLWKTNKSSRGDARARKLVPLYEKHGVDFVINGHIHSYERTWPIKAGKAVQQGVRYIIAGGGGGSLEQAGPYRPFFQNTVRRGHHFVMVRINGGTLQFQAYDLEGKLFDSLEVKK